MKAIIELQVNAETHTLEVDVRDSLLDMLREQLGLTGTKRGCDLGECGACTVLLDGRPVNACMLLAVDVADRAVLTIEGLAQEQLHAIQQAFVDNGAVQCGFCTPGMVLTAKAFLERSGNPTRTDVRRAISGNLCRCTGYQKIVDAIMDAASRLRKEETHV